MCLVIKSTEKLYNADHDIEVYKLLKVKGNLLFSPHMEFMYVIGQEKSAIMGFNASLRLFLDYNNTCYAYTGYASLATGLHSYSSFNMADRNNIYYAAQHVFLAVIPKGARYLKGERYEILSDRLKIIERLT